MLIRHAEPADYGAVIGVIDEWWGGREMAAMLPKLFFVHFRDTSFVAEEDGKVVGFLCGFRSQTFDDEAYIHFVGVDPRARAQGLGRALYERFFAAVAPRSIVRAVTAPVNERSVTRTTTGTARRACCSSSASHGAKDQPIPCRRYGHGGAGLPGELRRAAGRAAPLARRFRAAAR